MGSDGTESQNNELLKPRDQNYAYVGEIDEEAFNRARDHVVRADANMERFLEEIAKRESQGQPNNGYGAVGRGSVDRRALGKYQLQRDPLVDLGLRRRDGSWIGKPGAESETAFLTNNAIQEESIRQNIAKMEGYLKKNGSTSFVGQYIDGIAGGITVSQSGLVAAGLRAGQETVKAYLNHLQANGWVSDETKFPPKLSDSFKALETRLREFEAIPYR